LGSEFWYNTATRLTVHSGNFLSLSYISVHLQPRRQSVRFETLLYWVTSTLLFGVANLKWQGLFVSRKQSGRIQEESAMPLPTLAREFMTTKLVTLSPEMDVFAAIDLLVKNRISGAPVIDEQHQFLGIFSEKCCMEVLVDAAYEQLPSTKLFAFMNPDAETITEETDLPSIAQIFRTTRYRRLPVLREKTLVGQVSRRDVLIAAHKLIHISPDRGTALLYISSLVEISDAPIG